MLSSHSTLKNKDKFDTAIDQQTQTEEEPPEIDQNIYMVWTVPSTEKRKYQENCISTESEACHDEGT